MSDVTQSNLTLALLDQKVAGEFREKRYAYVAVLDGDGYGLGIAVDGERGYNPIGGLRYNSFDEAHTIADGMNQHIGLTLHDADVIVASTMRKG